LGCISLNRLDRQGRVVNRCLDIRRAHRGGGLIGLLKYELDKDQRAVKQGAGCLCLRRRNWIVGKPVFELPILGHCIPIRRGVKAGEQTWG
jgi:hypothetical protein